MHVLLLALNYWPDKLGNAPLMIGMCEGLVRRGHRVTVVCAFPHHETGSIEPPFRGKLLQRDHHNGVDIVRTYIYAPQGGMVAKMANYGSFTATAMAAASTVRNVDVIFTPSPPLTLGLVDYAIARTRRIPFVYNLQDLFPEAAVRLGMLTNPVVIRSFERLERWVYKRASRLSVISEGFRRYLLGKGVPDEKITVVPNYTDTDFITPQPHAGNRYRATHGLDEKFVVQFSGRMGYSQGLETVIAAWRSLTDLDDLRLMMVGDGAERPLVARELGDDARVTILPTQPREHLPELLAASDVGLAPLRHGMAGTSVPSKIFGILAAGRPVIAGVDVDSDTDEMITTADCGLVVTPEDPDALAAAIRTLYGDRKRAAQMGANGRDHVTRFHTQDVVVAQYERMLLDVIGRA